MSFFLSKVLWVLIAPGNLLAGLFLVAGLGWIRGRNRGWRWPRVLFGAAITLLAVLTVFPFGDWMMTALESRFPRPTLPERVDGIIVLGGMIDTTATEAWGRPTLNHQAERLTEFIDLGRRYPGAKMVFTGGSGALFGSSLTEAQIAREVLDRLGFDVTRVIFEDKSRNTQENVVFSKELAGPKPGETWVLITSGLHMARSVGIFRHEGWPVLPDPVAYRGRRGKAEWFAVDLAGNLYRLDEVVHEWIGLIAYHLLGRTDAWLPGP